MTDSRVVRALAHPLRVQILDALSDRVSSPSDLAKELGTPLALTSYHVRQLVKCDMLTLVDTVQRRGAVEHYYRAKVRPRITGTAWEKVPAIVKEALLAAQLEKVGEEVRTAALDGGFERPDIHFSHVRVTLDEDGWSKVSQSMLRLLDEIEEIAAESERRLAKADHEGERSGTAVLMLFDSPPAAKASSSARRRAGQRARRA